jgi:hypothetical protein
MGLERLYGIPLACWISVLYGLYHEKTAKNKMNEIWYLGQTYVDPA